MTGKGRWTKPNKPEPIRAPCAVLRQAQKNALDRGAGQTPTLHLPNLRTREHSFQLAVCSWPFPELPNLRTNPNQSERVAPCGPSSSSARTPPDRRAGQTPALHLPNPRTKPNKPEQIRTNPNKSEQTRTQFSVCSSQFAVSRTSDLPNFRTPEPTRMSPYNRLIRMLRNHSGPPWSWKQMKPFSFFP